MQNLYVSFLSQGGLDKATAMKVLKRWEETGATDPASLSKMLRRKSLDTVLAIVLQTVLDAGEQHRVHVQHYRYHVQQYHCETVLRCRGAPSELVWPLPDRALPVQARRMVAGIWVPTSLRRPASRCIGS